MFNWLQKEDYVKRAVERGLFLTGCRKRIMLNLLQKLDYVDSRYRHQTTLKLSHQISRKPRLKNVATSQPKILPHQLKDTFCSSDIHICKALVFQFKLEKSIQQNTAEYLCESVHILVCSAVEMELYVSLVKIEHLYLRGVLN